MNFNKRAFIFLAAGLCFFSSFKQKETTWVAIGDSITYLNDHKDETGNRVTKGYLTDVTDHFAGLQYINKGFNGWTSGNIAQQIDSLGLVKADIYSVFLGTNDWWQGRPVGRLNDYKNNAGNGTVYGSFRIILNKLRSLNPRAKILLITPMQRTDFVYIGDPTNNAYGSYKAKNGQYLEAFANAVDSIGRYEHLPVIDLYHNHSLDLKDLISFKRLKDPNTGAYVNYRYPEYTHVPFNPPTDEYPYPKEAINLTYDGLHPSDKGNAIIAGKIVEAFKGFKLALEYKANTQSIDTATFRWKKYINLATYMQPFWKTDTITDETVQLIKDSTGTTARLLFKAKKVLSVKAANHSKVFVKGADWDYKNGRLVFGPQSTIPYFGKDELVFNANKPGFSLPGKVPGTYVLFHEGAYFSSKQIAVTYIKDRTDIWKGPVPHFAAALLPNSLDKLKTNRGLKIVFYGNSIEVGHNASGFENAPPYMPTWPELVIRRLKLRYGNNITFSNKAVSGTLARWGLDSVANRVISEHPDLVIIGFGMNDGTARIAPGIYREQIKGIIDSVSLHNPHAEFILIAPMLANPMSGFSGLQALYKSELDKLRRKGVVVADITGVHQELLKHKAYQDMTGNNINHPNDYLARWYAQFISGILIR